MEYEIIANDETEKEVNISIPSTELERFIDEEVGKMRKDLTLNGFRKGKVPKNIIRNRYLDTLKARAMNNLVAGSFLKILDEKKWRPASQAELINVEEGENIKLRLRFEIIPDFNIDNYMGLEIFKEEPLPDDFLFEQAINRLREQYATIKEVSRPSVVDDLVTLEIVIVENNTVKSKQDDIVVKIGDRSLPDEINRVLAGARKSEKKEVKIGNQIHKISIKKIEEKILPQIDADFAKTQNCENVEQLKKEIMTSAKKVEEKRIEGELKESLSNTILERMKFKVPKTLTQNEYQRMLQKSNLPDSEANKERFWDIAEKRVRLNLMLDKIAEKENIKVTEEEIMNVISIMGIKLNDENHDNVIGYIGNILSREKTIDFLFQKAQISEKKRIISPKEAINDTSSVRH